MAVVRRQSLVIERVGPRPAFEGQNVLAQLVFSRTTDRLGLRDRGLDVTCDLGPAGRPLPKEEREALAHVILTRGARASEVFPDWLYLGAEGVTPLFEEGGVLRKSYETLGAPFNGEGSARAHEVFGDETLASVERALATIEERRNCFEALVGLRFSDWVSSAEDNLLRAVMICAYAREIEGLAERLGGSRPQDYREALTRVYDCFFPVRGGTRSLGACILDTLAGFDSRIDRMVACDDVTNEDALKTLADEYLAHAEDLGLLDLLDGLDFAECDESFVAFLDPDDPDNFFLEIAEEHEANVSTLQALACAARETKYSQRSIAEAIYDVRSRLRDGPSELQFRIGKVTKEGGFGPRAAFLVGTGLVAGGASTWAALGIAGYAPWF